MSEYWVQVFNNFEAIIYWVFHTLGVAYFVYGIRAHHKTLTQEQTQSPESPKTGPNLPSGG
jgi:hypothetical protein